MSPRTRSPAKLPRRASTPPKRPPAPLRPSVQRHDETTRWQLSVMVGLRPAVSLDERFECLLWSWPVARLFGPRPEVPLWTGTERDDEETRVRREAVLTRLDLLESLLYPATPLRIRSPAMQANEEILEMCQDLCHELRMLPGLLVDDPGDDLLWITEIYEFRYGDGQRDDRRVVQDDILRLLRRPSERVEICEIAERSRDAAWLSAEHVKGLDELREGKKQIQQFRHALEAVLKPKQKQFVEDFLSTAPLVRTISPDVHVFDLVCHNDPDFKYHDARTAFHRAYQDLLASSHGVLDYFDFNAKVQGAEEGRTRRATAGKPPRPWVTDADRALKALKLSPLDRCDLLQAWGLTVIPDE